MTTVHIRGWALAASCLACAQAWAQTPLPTPQTLTLAPVTQTLLDATNASVLSISAAGSAASKDFFSNAPVARFDAAGGVLLGVSGRLTIANSADTFLVSSVGDGGLAAASLATHWVLGSPGVLTQTPVGAAFTTLVDLPQHAGPGSTFSNSWAAVVASPTALADFVGSGTVNSAVVARLRDENINNGNGNTNRQVAANAFIAPAANRTGAVLAPLQAQVSVSYSFLQHANASFDSGADSNTLALALGNGASPAAFSVFALGGAGTTLLDYSQAINCTGDCSHFSLALGSFNDLAAGTSTAGQVALLGPVGNFRASYTLSFDDDTAVGAAASLRSNQLRLDVASVSAVPEANGGAMLLAGLGAIAWLSRRRGAWQQSAA
ncbi:MAG: hypothetical protein RLZZ584_1525 [Pseudomonadota bacterium]|jgi:hypothetical protein